MALPATPARRIVVDIGNTRIKWGLLDDDGRLASRGAWEIATDSGGQAGEWAESLRLWTDDGRAEWAVSSVNPPAAEAFGRWLRTWAAADVTWYRSAADVPIETRILEPNRAGADRALAVLAARTLVGPPGPGLVVSCGTALTIERIDRSGVWEGGAIAAGLRAVSKAMKQSTAQLPEIKVVGEVAPWGNATETAMNAGAFWGIVGALRELTGRQGYRRWQIWTGGDAPRLFPFLDRDPRTDWLIPDLVLRGLAVAAFGVTPEPSWYE